MQNRFSKLLSISAAHFMNDFYMSLIAPISFIFAEKFGLSLTMQGLLVFVIMAFGNLTQPIVGNIVDKKGKTYFIILSLVWISFWMNITGLINNYYLLLVVVGLGATASALFHPLASSTVINIGNESKGKMLSVFMTLGTLAGAVSPMISIPLIKTYGLSSLTYFMIPGFIIALFMYLTRVQDIEFISKKEKKQIKESKYIISSYAKRIMSVLVIISMNRSFIRRVGVAFGIQILLAKGTSLSLATLLLTIHLFLAAGGTLFGGVLNDKFGSRRTLVFFNIIAGSLFTVFAFSSGILAFASFAMLGMSLSITNTSTVVMSHELFPKNVNTGYGFVAGLATGLSGLGLLILGKFADIFNLNYAIKFILLPVFILILLSVLLPKKLDEDKLNESIAK
ncbi:MFS transporter [Helicovermis profundi]|uniref:MFS transporter n=1 Tax=Helicovermis profundi TaxID=3065157 RepID=A0AAU9E5P6_9FIRM|nr:MFS transporter [Clostridia bacterium S502]